MTHRSNARGRDNGEGAERRHREAGLDKTIEASFPASDPPSTVPNPDAHDAGEEEEPDDRATAPEG